MCVKLGRKNVPNDCYFRLSIIITTLPMFSAFEAAAHVQIVVHTPQVYLGGIVTGVVVLKVVKESIDGNSLTVTFFCKEDTRADYTTTSTDSDGKSTTDHHTTYQTANIVSVPLQLAVSNTGSFAQGQYEFPFTFQLKTDLPSSMSASLAGSEGGSCGINYSLFAKLERTAGIFKYKIEDTKPIVVLPVLTPGNMPRTPVVIGPLSNRVVFCCCFDRGKFDLGLASPSNWFAPNEAFEVSYVVQNDSHARIEDLKIGFYEKISWSANGYNRWTTRPVYTSLQGAAVSSLVPLKKHPEKAVLSMEELHRILVNGTNKYPMMIPSTVFPSYHGTLITSTHALSMLVMTPSGTSNPSIECPISIAYKAAVPMNAPEMSVQMVVPNGNGVSPSYSGNSVVPVVEAYPVSTGMSLNSQGYQPVPTVEVPNLSTPSDPPTTLEVSSSYQSWISSFKSSFHQVQDIRNCSANEIQSWNTTQFTEIFSSIRSSIDCVTIVELIIEKRSSITCDLILAAILASSTLMRGDMVRKFVVKCIDKENYPILKQGLSELDFMECSKLFR